MRVVAWLLRAFIFFTLFAFALNNQQGASVRWFFGLEWRAPMVIIVLVAFAAGAAIGVLAMVPNWWRARRAADATSGASGAAPAGRAAGDLGGPSLPPAGHPPREGL